MAPKFATTREIWYYFRDISYVYLFSMSPESFHSSEHSAPAKELRGQNESVQLRQIQETTHLRQAPELRVERAIDERKWHIETLSASANNELLREAIAKETPEREKERQKFPGWYNWELAMCYPNFNQAIDGWQAQA